MTQQKSRGRRRSAVAGTAWQRADWYLGMTGKDGHAYHRHLALPALLELMDLPTGAEVLDIGCGPGVPAPHFARRGQRYTGLDASAHMIAQARRWHGQSGTFVQGDARRLRAEVHGKKFDAAFFLLSLQDMHPLQQVIAEAAACLHTGGLLVLVLTHPCFRVPRCSGWGWDNGRKLHFRRVDRYLTPLSIGSLHSQTTSFHRPLQDYVAALYAAGLVVEQLRELAPTPQLLRQIGREKAAGNNDIPALLVLTARK